MTEATQGHTTLNGFHLGKVIGRGGMGVVFSGLHVASGTEVAVKHLLVGELAVVLAQLLGKDPIRPVELDTVDGGHRDDIAQVLTKPPPPPRIVEQEDPPESR